LHYDDVANDHHEENGNNEGRNSDNNNRGKGGSSGTVVGGNNNSTSIGNGDGYPSNTSQEEPTKEGLNQEVQLQGNPAMVDGNINFEVPYVVISVTDNVDLDKNVPIVQIFSTVA
jgi:hypothetical protein